MGNLTIQQKMVFDRLTAADEKITSLTKEIRARVNFVTTASSTLVGIVTASKLFVVNEKWGTIPDILILVIYLLFILIYGIAASTWISGNSHIASSFDINLLYKQYISQNLDNAYHNMLVDQTRSIELNLHENKIRSEKLKLLVIVLSIQIVLIAAAIGWVSLEPE